MSRKTPRRASSRTNLRVVDTNVVIIANRRDGGSRICANACSQALWKIAKTGRLALDSGLEIFGEYKKYCSFSGQPGVGDAFFKWVHDNLWRSEKVVRVKIKRHKERGYVEFPDLAGLAAFDPSDRKFVAVAARHSEHPPILQAADSKWWGFREALFHAGITVVFLCPDEIESIYLGKKKE